MTSRPSPIAAPARCAHESCEQFLIAKLPTERGTSIALDGAGFAYVATFFDDAIYRVSLQPGATPTLLYHSPGEDLGDVEVHGDELRWSSNATGAIYAAPVSGKGPVRVIADTLPGIWGFASDEEWIYWADFSGSAPGTIWKKALRGGPSVAIARHAASTLVDHVMIDAESDALLFTDQSGRVLRAPTSGGDAEIWLEVDGLHRLSGLTADDTYVYLADFGDHRVVRVDRRTRSVEIVATDQASPGNVAVDATHVYWVNYTPVEVWGRPK